MLLDRFGRKHNNLRISVTDRCNIRCFYCMPAENVQFMDKTELLTFEELERFVRVAVLSLHGGMGRYYAFDRATVSSPAPADS